MHTDSLQCSKGFITATTVQADLFAVRQNAGIANLRDRAFLRVTGTDATRWLNGMVTNSIQSLQSGEGNYNFLLSAQGRIQGDCTIYREPGDQAAYLVETSGDQVDTIQQLLDKFIIMDDVELTRAHEQEESVLVVGASAASILQHLGLPGVEPFHFAIANVPDGDVLLFATPSHDTPRYELRSTPGLIASLSEKAVAFGAIELSADDVESLRILSGIPRYRVDIRDRDLPQETNQPHALHFAKGCYLGQEIVERIRSRGQVHRLLTPFILHGVLPTLPSPIETNEKSAGELTSAVHIGDTIYALGYARREALETRQPLTYNGGTATPRTIATRQSIQQHENPHG